MADVVIAGAAGRMGCRLVALLQEDKDLRLVAALEAPGHPALLKDAGEIAGVGKLGVPITADPEGALGRDRILIEFSVPDASLGHLRMTARQGGRAVIGTTGFAAAQREEIERLAREVPILLSPNMSVGVNVAFRVLADMARLLGDDYDVEISEVHHRFKKDAPSGTAAKMAEVVAQALGRDLTKVGVYGRHGLPGERTRKEIGVHSLRSGDVVGDHTVSFGNLGERLELTHRAQNRDTYVRGALRAAKFITQAKPGLYAVTADTLTEVRPQPVALTFSPTVNMPTKVRPPRVVLTTSPTVKMPTKVRPQRIALTLSPTVNMPKGMLRIK